MEARIDTFSTEENAKAFFANSIVESEAIDGFMLKRSGYFSIYKNEAYKSDLDSSEEVYLVISYPKGTGFAIDGSSAAPAEESAPEQE